MGNVFGGVGLSAEIPVRGRVSAVVGIGVLPHEPVPVAAAAALRFYPSRIWRNVFVQLSIASLAVEIFEDLGGTGGGTIQEQHYGPGIVVGYAHVARSGFALIAGAGAGWSADLGYVVSMAQLGIGYAFQSRPR